MTRKILLGAVAAMLLLTLLATAANEQPWFDFKNCEMCKHLTEIPDLMQHLHYQQVKVSNGFIAVTTADPGYVEQYKKVSEEMNAVGERLMAGEQMQLCGSCQALGALFMSGAKMEQGNLDNGDLMLVSSDNPELVTKLHEYVDKSMGEMKKMMSDKPKAEESK